MTPTVLRGLTWDHPRAYQGLDAETALLNTSGAGVVIQWEKHSLRRFEEAPLDELASIYDLIIFDHPFVGDAADLGCLLDLKRRADALDLPGIAADSLGPSYRSYEYGGAQWAVPIDAACQTAAYRPDLLEHWGEPVPRTLTQVLDFAQRREIALALSVPHAFMNHLSLCALMGAEIGGEGAVLVDSAVSIEAIEIQRQLVRSVPKAAVDWSSIRTLDSMSSSTRLGYCPFVFCFNSYSRPDRKNGGAALRFASPPALSGGRPSGPVVGGAGLAVSARCPFPESALLAVAHLMRPESHRRMAIAGGQVGRASAWADHDADGANGGFFGDCRAAMESSRVRPRHRGYIGFQNAAGALLREHVVTSTLSSRSVAERLQELYWQSWREGQPNGS